MSHYDATMNDSMFSRVGGGGGGGMAGGMAFYPQLLQQQYQYQIQYQVVLNFHKVINPGILVFYFEVVCSRLI